MWGDLTELVESPTMKSLIFSEPERILQQIALDLDHKLALFWVSSLLTHPVAFGFVSFHNGESSSLKNKTKQNKPFSLYIHIGYVSLENPNMKSKIPSSNLI